MELIVETVRGSVEVQFARGEEARGLWGRGLDGLLIVVGEPLILVVEALAELLWGWSGLLLGSWVVLGLLVLLSIVVAAALPVLVWSLVELWSN